MRLEKTAVTEWPAANVGHTQVNLNASVRRAITGKVCSMSAQVSLWCKHTLSVIRCCETNEPGALWLQKCLWLFRSLPSNSFGLNDPDILRILSGFSDVSDLAERRLV